MTARADSLKQELQSLYREWSGDEGLLLTRATEADHAEVAELVKTMPLEEIVQAVAVVLSEAVCDAVQQQGKRPADYWKDTGLAQVMAERVAKVLKEPQGEYAAAFHAYMRGRG